MPTSTDGAGAELSEHDTSASIGQEPALAAREVTPCPSCGRFWFHKEGCTDDH